MIMKLPSTALILPLLAFSALHAADAPPVKYHRFEPLTPAESLKGVHLPPGYGADIVASEPLIQEPVWVEWDGDGAMYVAEMNSYMRDTKGTDTKSLRNGRIKRLTDPDGDGIMDQATVFVDHLLLPRMILALDDRIIVQETDDTSLVAWRDTDGDGVADEKTVLHAGPPSAISVEHQDSALTWNIDNWLYTAQGGLRFRYTDGKLRTERVLEEFNQWGMGMDDTGVMFHSQNSIPGRNFNQHWYYWNLIGERRQWKRFTRPTFGPETDADFQLTYRTQPIGDRADVCEKSWTSACGLSIYRGDALPVELYGNMMLAEPCGHFVRRAVIQRDEHGRRSLRNAHEKAEFFMSDDFYSRPVSTHTGPDGCLYIVDMYRGMIQDAPWVSPQFAERIQGMGADQVMNRGRIYRISHESRKPGPRPQLLAEKPAALVPHLAHANGWWRDMAQRLIILRGDKSVIPALHAMALSDANPLGRLHALWTLEGMDALTSELLAAKLKDADYRLRAAAIRLHEPALRQKDSTAVVSALAAMADDSDPEVRRQLVLSLGWSAEPQAVEIIQKIATREPANPIITLATLTALHGREELPIVKQVQDESLFRSIGDAAQRTQAQSVWKAGLETWKNVTAKPRINTPAELALIEKGARIYQETCLACQGPDGKGFTPPGAATLAPPLVGSARVLGPKEALVRILMHGLTGPVDGKSFVTGQMAPLGTAFPDDWSASVLTYIRQEWTNDASAITAPEVRSIRSIAEQRKTPWTLDELALFAAPALIDRHDWTATASGHTPKNAIDGISDGSHQHAWHGANNPGAWLAVDLGSPHRLTHLIMHSTEADWAPRGYKVEISDDGKTWSAPIAEGKGTGMKTVASFEPVVTRHLRITQTGNAIERWLVSELELHGSTTTP